jgi:hypothetical protein
MKYSIQFKINRQIFMKSCVFSSIFIFVNGKLCYAPVTKTTQIVVRPRSSTKRSRNLLKFENKSRFQVHTTTKVSFHHVRCRLLLRAGSISKYVHHVFATSSIRPYNSHYDLSTFLSRLHCVRSA